MSLAVVYSFFFLWLSYLALEVIFYWTPLFKVWNQKRIPPPYEVVSKTEIQDAAVPKIAVLSACRDGVACIPGLAKTFGQQLYPKEAIHLYLVADHCQDNSADVARDLGMTVLERSLRSQPGKGNAVSEMTDIILRNESFDYLVVLDIDARVEPDFLKRMLAYFSEGTDMLSFATQAKNPDDSLLAHAGWMIQALLRMHQSGRAALGVNAILYGSHGYALSRHALSQLGWRTTTGQIAEDMELCLRAFLAGLTIRYAADISVFNDVTADVVSVRAQRTRWNATYPPLILQYAKPLLWRIIQGDFRSLEMLFGVLLLPSFANLFLFLLGSAICLGSLAWRVPSLRIFAVAAALLWAIDAAYFPAAFAMTKIPLRLREFRALAAHLFVRTMALLESPFHLADKDWTPAPHTEEQ